MTRPLIANITAASDIRATLRYDLVGKDSYNPRPDASLIASSLATSDVDKIIRVIQNTLNQHRRLKNPLFRVSLSLPSGVRLNPLSWRLCAIFWMRLMHIDPDRFDWYLAHHPTQTDHDHCHLTICRIPHSSPLGVKGGTGAFRLWNSFRRGQAACLKAAAQLGIDVIVQEKAIAPNPDIALSAALELLLNNLLSRPQTLPTLFQALLEHQVIPKLHIASTGRISGISFRVSGGPRFKGSSLKFGWQRIRDQVSFLAERDLPLLNTMQSDLENKSMAIPPVLIGDLNANNQLGFCTYQPTSPSLRDPIGTGTNHQAAIGVLGIRNEGTLAACPQVPSGGGFFGNRFPATEQISSDGQSDSRSIRAGACTPGTRRVGRCSRSHPSPPLLTADLGRLETDLVGRRLHN